MPIIIEHDPLWAAATTTYVVGTEPGGPAVIIDAPPDPDAVLDLVARRSFIPVALLITHGHIDHVGGAGDVVRKTGVTAYLHPDDEWLARAPEQQLRGLFGIVPPDAGAFAPPERFTDLDGGAKLTLAGLEIEVLHTPGHTPGHCCFRIETEGLLFSGDQLFAGAVGRWDLPGGDYATLMDSMEREIVSLPPETEVLPGHGPATTLARELATNPFLVDLRP